MSPVGLVSESANQGACHDARKLGESGRALAVAADARFLLFCASNFGSLKPRQNLATRPWARSIQSIGTEQLSYVTPVQQLETDALFWGA
jgi:hypothetical protein